MQKFDLAYAKVAEERGYFPLKVLYDGRDTASIVERADDLLRDVPFLVLDHARNGESA